MFVGLEKDADWTMEFFKLQEQDTSFLSDPNPALQTLAPHGFGRRTFWTSVRHRKMKNRSRQPRADDDEGDQAFIDLEEADIKEAEIAAEASKDDQNAGAAADDDAFVDFFQDLPNSLAVKPDQSLWMASV